MGEAGTRKRRSCGWLALWLAGVCVVCAGLPCGIGWTILQAKYGIHAREGWIDSERQKLPAEVTLAPPAVNAYDTYRQAAALLSEPSDPFLVAPRWWDTAPRPRGQMGYTPPRSIVAMVRRNAPALAKLHEAADQEYVRPPRSEPFDISVLSEQRHLSGLALAAACVAHGQGNDTRALGYVEDAYALALDMPRGGAEMESGLGSSRIWATGECSRRVLLWGDAPPNALRAHAARMRELGGRMWPLSNTITRSAQEDLGLLGEAGPEGALSGLEPMTGGGREPEALATLRALAMRPNWEAEFTWYEDRMARLAEAADKPFGNASFDDLMARTGSDLDARNDPALWGLCGLYSHVRDFWLRGRGLMIADEAIACLCAYRLEHGAYPPSLAELVPDYMPETPQDPWTGDPMIHRLLPDGSFVLYAAGANKVDDGGRRRTGLEDEAFDEVYVPLRAVSPAGP